MPLWIFQIFYRYVLGSACATLVPVVGWMPLRSIEQMPSMAVFMGFQVLELCDWYRRRREMGAVRFCFFRVSVFATIAVVTCGVCWTLGRKIMYNLIYYVYAMYMYICYIYNISINIIRMLFILCVLNDDTRMFYRVRDDIHLGIYTCTYTSSKL